MACRPCPRSRPRVRYRFFRFFGPMIQVGGQGRGGRLSLPHEKGLRAKFLCAICDGTLIPSSGMTKSLKLGYKLAVARIIRRPLFEKCNGSAQY